MIKPFGTVGIINAVHLSDRLVGELSADRSSLVALRVNTTGIGGALPGNTVTLSTLVVHPIPLLPTFGTVVVLALPSVFLATVVTHPSLLKLWRRYGPNPAPKMSQGGTN